MSPVKPTILVTEELDILAPCSASTENAGYGVVVLDNLVYGHRDLVEKVLQVELIVGDTNDRLLDELFASHKIAAVIFSAYAYVESVTEPDKYYRNNVVGT